MASLASQTLRAASRRVPRTASKVARKPASAASYSLLAATRSGLASALPRRATTFEVFLQIRRLVLHISSDTFSFFFWFLSRAPHHLQSVRGVKTLDFAGSQEVVYERSDWPLAKLQDYFKNDTLALIGYGSQGHGQGLNARDNGLKVIVGVRENGESWKQALEDGWVRAYAQNFPRCL
jgi:ketol-acid reductoisomerase